MEENQSAEVAEQIALTDFSATTLGELATSNPLLSPPACCMKFIVASVFRSCIISVSLAGIFARKFFAIGYPVEGTCRLVSTIHC